MGNFTAKLPLQEARSYAPGIGVRGFGAEVQGFRARAKLPGAILRLRLGNAPKLPSGSSLGPFRAQGLKMLQSGLLEAPWCHFELRG